MRSIIQGTQLFDVKEVSGLAWGNASQTLTGNVTIAGGAPVVQAFLTSGTNRVVSMPPLSGANAIIDGRVFYIVNNDPSGANTIQVAANAADGGANLGAALGQGVGRLYVAVRGRWIVSG